MGRLRATNEALRTINALTDELYRAPNLETLARRAVTSLMLYSESPSVSFFLYHGTTGELELLHARKFTEETTAVIRMHPTRGTLSGRAVSTREVVVCGNMQTEPTLSPSLREASRREGVGCGISIPLLFEDRALGAINLIFHGPRDVSAAERDILRSIGQTVGLAVANALYVARIETEIRQRRLAEAELQRHHDHLEELVADRTAELARARDRAEESDRLKSVFLAAISHELRTPLNSILGFTTTVSSEMAGPVNEEQARQLGFVRASADHLLSVINDLLDLSQMEAGRMEPVPEPIDLSTLIDQTISTVEPLACDKGLTVRADCGKERCTIVSDRRRVAQVLLNLADNAVKFSSAGEILIRCRCGERSARIEVIDPGIGIAPEDLGSLFKPFSQLDAIASRSYAGTGLGLSISKRLVELLGGEIGVESEPGRGSAFHFTLPR